jgi:hypothetical protein
MNLSTATLITQFVKVSYASDRCLIFKDKERAAIYHR